MKDTHNVSDVTTAQSNQKEQSSQIRQDRRRFIQATGWMMAAGVSPMLAACGGGADSAQGTSSPAPETETTPPDTSTPEEPSPAPGATIASFSVVGSATGSNVPFVLGQVFRKGDVPSGQGLMLDTPAFQVVPVSVWDDGSVKHALIAGRVDLSANVPREVAISQGSSSGAALTEAALVAANPDASIAYGSYGTVTLGTLLGTGALVLAEQAGPQYAAFQYIQGFPNDSSVRAVFYVQLWAGGSYRVRVAVEIGTAPSSGSAKSGTATVTIAGVVRFSGSVSMSAGTRWDAVGANFAMPDVLHDVTYLRATKLVPNFGYTSPSATALNALPTAYTPLDGLHYETDMGAPGYAEAIGLLPHWDALYCTSGDTRARDSVLAHGRAYGCYGIFFRDGSTRRMPAFTDFPTAYANNEDMGATGYRWEVAHHPNAGYLPWLLTAERFHLETMHANAWACYFTLNPNGAGANRIYNSQTRGRAWRLRTLAAVAAVSPTNDPVAVDCRANVAANFSHWKSTHVDVNSPATGLIGIYDDKDSGTSGFQHSIFESLFLVSSIGWAWDMEPGWTSSQRSTHQAVRDFAYRAPVGLTGRGPAVYGEYSYRRAPGPYRMTIGPDSSSLYATWGEVYQATYGDQLDSADGLSILESYADDSGFPYGNWGHVITALSYAKDHGATGAAAGYARVTGASNWDSNAVNFNDRPSYGVLSRT